MTNEDTAKYINALAEKAANAEKSDDAMRFSQAANNIANARCALKAAEAKQA